MVKNTTHLNAGSDIRGIIRLLKRIAFFVLIAFIIRRIYNIELHEKIIKLLNYLPGRLTTEQVYGVNLPVFSESLMETEDANPFYVSRLLVFIMLCVALTIPFFL